MVSFYCSTRIPFRCLWKTKLYLPTIDFKKLAADDFWSNITNTTTEPWLKKETMLFIYIVNYSINVRFVWYISLSVSGHKYAMIQMKLAILDILKAYKLLPVTKPQDVRFTSDLMLRSTKPIYVKFELRNK